MGRQQFESVTASATRQVLVSTPITLAGQNLNPGQGLNVDLFAPAGFIGQIKNLTAFASLSPSNFAASSGDHSLAVTTTVGTGGIIQGNFPNAIAAGFRTMQFGSATTIFPNDLLGVITALKDFVFDSSVGFRVAYNNNSNVAMTNFSFTCNVIWLKILAA